MTSEGWWRDDRHGGDGAGRVTRTTDPTGTTTYGYDPAGRTIEVAAPAGTVAYGYDDAGQRTTMVQPTGTVGYDYDVRGHLDTVTDPTGTIDFDFDPDGKLLTASRPNGVTTEDSNQLLPDAIGSIRATTDAAGTVTNTTDYTAFGETLTGSTGLFGYAGEQADPTGLVHLRARQYDPTQGRFTSVDPVQPGGPGTGGWNHYTYAGNNPTTWTDPTGQFVGYATTNQVAVAAAAAATLTCLATVPCKSALEELSESLAGALADVVDGIEDQLDGERDPSRRDKPDPKDDPPPTPPPPSPSEEPCSPLNTTPPYSGGPGIWQFKPRSEAGAAYAARSEVWCWRAEERRRFLPIRKSTCGPGGQPAGCGTTHGPADRMGVRGLVPQVCVRSRDRRHPRCVRHLHPARSVGCTNVETAHTVMWMTHPEREIADQASAGRYLRRAIHALGPAVPQPEWRSGEGDVPVPTDRIDELSIPIEHSTPNAGFSWSVVSGSPPRDLHLQATIGTNQVSSAVKLRLRLEDPAELSVLDAAFDRLWDEFRSDLDRLHLSVGVDFLLRQRRDTDEHPLPTVGWRNLLRRPAQLDLSDIELPPWVTVERNGEHLQIILGPDARSLDPASAAAIRDQLVAAGYL